MTHFNYETSFKCDGVAKFSLCCVWKLPSDTRSDLREVVAVRSGGLGSGCPWWGAFLGATPVTEDAVSASSDSTSVGPGSSLELDSVLRGPLERRDAVSGSLALWAWTEAGVSALEEPLCSDECEDRDSMLPMGVLPGLLLDASPVQGPEGRHAGGGASLKSASSLQMRNCSPNWYSLRGRRVFDDTKSSVIFFKRANQAHSFKSVNYIQN